MPLDHRPDHDHKPKLNGPKERELAVALTVAVLSAAQNDSPLEALERTTLANYGRIHAGITRSRPSERGDRRE